ncbi:MAG: winged helix-turn-helix domain-containing protein [Desulfuromonadales bacterium]|nr:winged helix-turn-helix domain-containing protein [Desulfuromonadales bacterium]
MDLLKAIEDVLKSAHQPLHVGVIAEKVISGGLWKSSGKTPEATISSAIFGHQEERRGFGLR